MIKWAHVLDLASKVFDEEAIAELNALKAKEFEVDIDAMIRNAKDSMEHEVLESVLKDECDFVIFEAYRNAKNLWNLYKEYKDEQYAVGS